MSPARALCGHWQTRTKETPMFKKSTLALSLLAASVSFSVLAASPEEKAEKAQYKADMARVNADYKEHMRGCKPMHHAEEKACKEQAKADRDHAEADIKAHHHG